MGIEINEIVFIKATLCFAAKLHRKRDSFLSRCRNVAANNMVGIDQHHDIT